MAPNNKVNHSLKCQAFFLTTCRADRLLECLAERINVDELQSHEVSDVELLKTQMVQMTTALNSIQRKNEKEEEAEEEDEEEDDDDEDDE